MTLRVSTQNLITFGILFGTFIGSLGTIVVTNAPNGDLLKQYYLWGAANFNLEGVTTSDIIFSLVLFAIGLTAAIWTAKALTRHMKEEIESVSYTHLDVYKRQHEGRNRIEQHV